MNQQQQPDTKPGFYYVSVRNGEDYRLLRGPFKDDHRAALDAVDAARRRACEIDPRGHWYAYGTCRTDDDAGPGLLDKMEAMQ